MAIKLQVPLYKILPFRLTKSACIQVEKEFLKMKYISPKLDFTDNFSYFNFFFNLISIHKNIFRTSDIHVWLENWTFALKLYRLCVKNVGRCQSFINNTFVL